MDWRISNETKRAMFWAALAAQHTGETHMTANRIAAALLRTDSIRELCARAQLDLGRLLDAVEDPQVLSFEECERLVWRELEEKGLEFASKEHQASVQRRPLQPEVLPVFSAILDRHGHMAASPLELLRDVLRADAALAARLAPHGLDAEAIDRALS